MMAHRSRVIRVLFGLLLALLAGLSTGCMASASKAAAAAPQQSAYDTAEAGGADAQPLAAADSTASDLESDAVDARSEAVSLGAAPAAEPPSSLGRALAQAPAEAPTPKRGEAPGDVAPAAPPPAASDVGSPPQAVAQTLLIYTAQLRMAVFEAAASIDRVEEAAIDAGGYLVRRDDEVITVRVPAVKFQDTLDQVTKLGDVLHRDIRVRDVTDRYYDLQVRLRNAQAVLARLEQLLARATNVKEALAVEAELSRVAEQVEQLEGRLKLLRELIAFSTITVRFEGRPIEQIESSVRLPFPWLPELGLAPLLRF